MTAFAGVSTGQPWLHEDLIDVLRRRAQEQPDEIAFSFLGDGRPDSALTYARLDRRARAVSARLQHMGLDGERALLAYSHGLEFIAGFFGCLYAGCTAVPTDRPHRRTLDRYAAIVADAGARLVLSDARAVNQHDALAAQQDAWKGVPARIPWLATDDIPDAEALRWAPPVITPGSLAVLQYTSGSTGRPKGVMLSHANLIHNARDIHRAFGMGRDSAVFWLPVYHDMGLIGGVVEPVLAGVPSALMAPSTFLRRPFAWLDAISSRRATISGGPGFAFDLCVRKVTAAQRATLDLSCWSLAFIGAEPIHPDTLDRFADAFGPCGFRRDAFYPCYGLAEATLLVSGAVRSGGPTVEGFDAADLARNRVSPAPPGAVTSRRLVSCGAPVGDLRVVVVDPRTGSFAAPDHVGEVWVSGRSVAMGYWRRPGPTARSFDARPRGTRDGPFLRTGDLGFLRDGRLFIIGRQDDLLIVRGLNHHPRDLEATARRCHPLLSSGLGTAFAADDPRESASPRLVLVQEVERLDGEADFTPALEAIRGAVLGEHGVALHAIVLVRCGTIPRTSSGKVQRRLCRSAFLAGELRALADYRAPPAASDGAEIPTTEGPRHTPGHRARGATPAIPDRAPTPSVFAAVCQHALALSGSALSAWTPETPLTALGLDSLQRVEFAATLERSFACRLPDGEFSPARTLGELAHAVQTHLTGRSDSEVRAGRIPPEHYDFARFPEYGELKRYERMLKAVAGEIPYLRVDEGGAPSAGIARIAGRDLVNFAVYDYLGLARDPEVAAAAKAAIDRYGTSAGASRLVSGEKRVHRDLERALAAFLGTDAAIVLVSGHATNVTTIGHLLGPDDLIVHDALAHNSIIQGAQLSRATRRAFAHNDWLALDALLSEVRHRYRRVLIAVEGVYSMDGDCPDLPRFVEVKKAHRALMLVDEAHSLGTMGPTGRGIGEHCGVARTDVDLWMGTLSKSLASCGGYIAGSAEVVEYLAYTAPGFVYSVGVSPANAAAALAALKVLEAQPQRVSRLRELSALFLTLAARRGLDAGTSTGTPVIPVIIGNSVKTLRLARALFDRGINVHPILPPAVPELSARLRFFITTNHTEAQIRDAVAAVADELAAL